MPGPKIAYVIGGTVWVDAVERFQLANAPKIMTSAEVRYWNKSARTSLVRALRMPEEEVIGQLLFDVRPHHLEILSIAVAEKYRRKRVATNLFWRLVTDQRSAVYPSITALVPDDCDGGIALFRFLRFRAIRLILGQKGERDKYLFSWERKTSDEKPIRVRISGGGDDDDGRPSLMGGYDQD